MSVDNSTPQLVSAEEVMEAEAYRNAANVLIVQVTSPDTFAAAHVPGAVLVTPTQLI